MQEHASALGSVVTRARLLFLLVKQSCTDVRHGREVEVRTRYETVFALRSFESFECRRESAETDQRIRTLLPCRTTPRGQERTVIRAVAKHAGDGDCGIREI